MTSNFVVAFGGTGARCVEALVYLQAAGVVSRSIQVLLIDPDTSNGNTSIARSQLIRYRSLQKVVKPRGEERKPFFSHPINEGDPGSSVSWDYPTPPEPFQSILRHAGQNEGIRGLLELLYDENDFQLSFEEGFVGRAHIGSLDVFRVLSRELAESRISEDEDDGVSSLVRFFRRVRSAAQGEGARVVVVGSLFGGTGASALPAVPPFIRDALGDVSEGIKIASVQVAPYFSFPPGGELDPDSALHPLATQAALYHYAGSDAYDSIYFLGAPERPQTSEVNRRGGSNQRNSAHYAELVGALGIRDFFFGASDSEGGRTLAAGGERADWSGFPSGSPEELQQKMTAFCTAALFHSEFLFEDFRKNRHRNHRWAEEIGTGGSELGGGESELEDLKAFTDRFLAWARQVSDTTDEPLFRLDDPLRARSLGKVGPGGKKDAAAYHELFSALNRVEDVDQSTPVGRYLEMLTAASHEFCAHHYVSWWGENR